MKGLNWQRVRVFAQCDHGCPIRFPDWALFGPFRHGRRRLVLCAVHAASDYKLTPPPAFGYNGDTEHDGKQAGVGDE